MNYFTALFAFAMAIGCFWISLKLIRIYLKVKKWNRVSAKVLSKEVILHKKYSSSRAPYGLKVEYSYNVNGIAYTGNKAFLVELANGQANMMRSDADKRLSKIENTSLIFVNPDDPKQSLLFCEGIGMYVAVFCLGLLSVLIGLGNLLP